MFGFEENNATHPGAIAVQGAFLGLERQAKPNPGSIPRVVTGEILPPLPNAYEAASRLVAVRAADWRGSEAITIQ